MADHEVLHVQDASPYEYVSPNLRRIDLAPAFPNRIVGNLSASDWPYLRRGVGRVWHVDRRNPTVGFTDSDEAALLYNTALLFQGLPCLEIGCWRGWSTAHIAAGSGSLDVIDPVLRDPDFLTDVKDSLARAGVLDCVQFDTGSSPEAVERMAATGAKRWSFVFIDGDHEGEAPRMDAEIVSRHVNDTALVMFHDLLSPHVAAGWRFLREQGWKTRIYNTAQIMGAAWRGDLEPVTHTPDPTVAWSLPAHLAGHRNAGEAYRLPAARVDIDDAFTRLLEKHVGLLGQLAAATTSPPPTAAPPPPPVMPAPDELDRLHAKYVAVIEQLTQKTMLAEQQSQDIAGLRTEIREGRAAFDQLRRDHTQLDGTLAALQARFATMAVQMTAAAASEQHLQRELDSAAAARSHLETSRQAALDDLEDLTNGLQRLQATHSSMAELVTTRSVQRVLTLVRGLVRPRIVAGLLRRRFVEPPAITLALTASMLASHHLEPGVVAPLAAWLQSRRVLLGLLRRMLTGRLSAARLAVLARIGETLQTQPCPTHVEIDASVRSSRSVAQSFQIEFERTRAELIDLAERHDRDIRRLRALEEAKIADEHALFELRVEMHQLEASRS